MCDLVNIKIVMCNLGISENEVYGLGQYQILYFVV